MPGEENPMGEKEAQYEGKQGKIAVLAVSRKGAFPFCGTVISSKLSPEPPGIADTSVKRVSFLSIDCSSILATLLILHHQVGIPVCLRADNLEFCRLPPG